MSLATSKLHKVAGAGGWALWVLKTADVATDVDTAGYFNAMANVMNVGDTILRLTFTSSAFTALSTAGFHSVSSNDGTTVDVNDALAITATDTD